MNPYLKGLDRTELLGVKPIGYAARILDEYINANPTAGNRL